MKIAVFHNIPSGGAKRALFEWVRRLAGRHHLDVFSLETADHKFCDIRPYVSQYHVYEFSPRSLFKSPFGRLNNLQRWRDLRDLERLNRRIAEKVNKGGYDVLFANTCMFTFIPILLQHVLIPSVYYLHEPFGPGFVRRFSRPYLSKDHWRELLNRFDPFIRLYHRRLVSLQKQSVLSTTTLLANSKFTRDCIQEEYGVNADFSPYGVDLNNFKPIDGCFREDFIVSVGEMAPRKGFDFIVQSLGEIPANCRPALKLACNVVQENELMYIKELAIQKEVDLEVLVGLGVSELRRLYNQAKICVYAPVMEPFGLVPLEAMACSTPVIGVREGGVQESVIHEYNGLLVDRDAKLFGAAIQYLLSNPDLSLNYGRNGREHVIKNWTWEKSVSSLNSYFAKCAGVNG